jgi:UDP-GlcNAc:undecaprenyl-phosphate GlcNAc-1-phosphate transferase
MINLFLFIILFNLFFVYYYNSFSKIYKLYDFPDNNRKIHKQQVPLLGGLILVLNIIIFLVTDIFFNKLTDKDIFISLISYLSFFVGLFLFYLIGFFDDKFQLSPNLKLFFMVFIITFFLIIDKNLILNNLKFSFYSSKISLKYFSYFFTIFCFLLFINAFNMLDGINGQAASYAIFVLIIIILKGIFVITSVSLIIALLFFLYLNFRNKSFLGDSGTLLLGYLISYSYIKAYNYNESFFADEIFLIMSVPGYELLRLAIKRIINRKHPFKPDNSHIHHLILKRENFTTTFLAIQLLLSLPYLIYFFFSNFFYSFFVSVIIYSSVVFIYSKEDHKNYKIVK